MYYRCHKGRPREIHIGIEGRSHIERTGPGCSVEPIGQSWSVCEPRGTGREGVGTQARVRLSWERVGYGRGCLSGSRARAGDGGRKIDSERSESRDRLG